MIKKIILKNFKKFREGTFEIDGDIVLAGPNNSGKTTLIQAIATWHYALSRWLQSGAKKQSVSINRASFPSVPLREFSQLWTEKSTGYKKNEKPRVAQGAPRPLEIEIFGEHKGEEWSLAMEFKYSNKDMVYVRPKGDKIGDGAKNLSVIHIPPFSGIGPKEVLIDRLRQDELVGEGKPGDILRNLLKELSERKDKRQWKKLQEHVKAIFPGGVEILEPLYGAGAAGASILSQYKYKSDDGKRAIKLDVNAAGSGFQQILLLLAFLYARPASVLLFDEPDAHLHFSLQNEAYERLRKISRENNSQLFIATHSEALIEDTPPENIISFFGEHPTRLSAYGTHSTDHHKMLMRALKIKSVALLRAEQSKDRVLFLEGRSDLKILREMARVLNHRIQKWLDDYTSYVYFLNGAADGESDAQDHLNDLRIPFPNMKGFILLDRNAENRKLHRVQEGNPLHGHVWNRYEIESYLIFPDAIHRFLSTISSRMMADIGKKELEDMISPASFKDPINDPAGDLQGKNASNGILLKVFSAAGLERAIPKSDYYRLAEQMKPEEFPPEVEEVLEKIAVHFEIPE